MTITDTAHKLPRVLVQSYLHAARIPLTAVARLARQQDNEQWPPTLAYQSFEAGVETIVGSVLGDTTLVENGQLRKARIAELRKAADLSTVAEQERTIAETNAEERRAKIAADRKETERRAQQSKQDIERQAELHEQKIQEKATKKATAARRAKARQEEAIGRQARVAKTSALTAESRALSIAKDALQADEKVEFIDETLAGTKAARKSS
jgi:hypothetical protein